MDAGGSAEAGGAESLPVFRGRYAIEIDIMLGLGGAPLFQEKDNQAARRAAALTRMPKQAIFIHPGRSRVTALDNHRPARSLSCSPHAMDGPAYVHLSALYSLGSSLTLLASLPRRAM